MRIVVVGLGNVLASDDAVGVRVIQGLATRGLPAGVQLVEANTPGLDLIPLLLDADRAILVDALCSGEAPGTISRLGGEELHRAPWHSLSGHGLGVLEALELGRLLYPARMPREVVLIGIEVERLDSYQEGLTPALQAAIPGAVEAVAAELRGYSEPGEP